MASPRWRALRPCPLLTAPSQFLLRPTSLTVRLALLDLGTPTPTRQARPDATAETTAAAEGAAERSGMDEEQSKLTASGAAVMAVEEADGGEEQRQRRQAFTPADTEPFDADPRVAVEVRVGARAASPPRADGEAAQVDLFSLDLQLSTPQYRGILSLVSEIAHYTLHKKYHLLRPSVPVLGGRERVRQWWRFAYLSVMLDVREQLKRKCVPVCHNCCARGSSSLRRPARRSWSQLLNQRLMRRRYIHLYKRSTVRTPHASCCPFVRARCRLTVTRRAGHGGLLAAR